MSRETDEIFHEIEECRALRSPNRAMRVLLECGHLRLIPQINTGMGVGAFTGCAFCAIDGVWASRLVMDIAETGVPWQEGMKMQERRP